MEKSERIAIARQIIDFMETGQPFMGDESWETGFVDQERFKLSMKVSLTEDLPARTSCQLMMETGAVSSVVFGKCESSLTGMHKASDASIDHDAASALRSNSARMGVSATR